MGVCLDDVRAEGKEDMWASDLRRVGAALQGLLVSEGEEIARSSWTGRVAGRKRGRDEVGEQLALEGPSKSRNCNRTNDGVGVARAVVTGLCLQELVGGSPRSALPATVLWGEVRVLFTQITLLTSTDISTLEPPLGVSARVQHQHITGLAVPSG